MGDPGSPRSAFHVAGETARRSGARALSGREDAQIDARSAALKQAHDTMQMKTFKRWWNLWLVMRELSIEDLSEDVKPGVKSIALLELVTDATYRYNKKPKSRFQAIENHGTFLSALAKLNIRLVNISPEDLADGNMKLVLAVTWTLIQRFEIQQFGSGAGGADSGADVSELLVWVNTTIEKAGRIDVRAGNWTYDFLDGRVFCALLNAHDRTCLDASEVGAAGDAARYQANHQLAFSRAEETYGAIKLLDAHDLVTGETIDKLSVITYVARLRQHFEEVDEANAAATARRQQQERERARRELEAGRDETARRRRELEARAYAWRAQTQKAMAALKTQDLGRSAEETRALLGALRQTPESAPLRAPLAEIEAEAAAVEERQLRQMLDAAQLDAQDQGLGATAGRAPPPALPEGLAAETLHRHLAALEAAEIEREAALQGRLAEHEVRARQKATDALAAALLPDARALLRWLGDRAQRDRNAIKGRDLGDSDNETKRLLDAAAAWAEEEQVEREAEKNELQYQLRELAARLKREERGAPEVDADALEKAWGTMEKARRELLAALEAQRRQHAERERQEATDAAHAHANVLAAEWLKKAADRAADFNGRVKRKQLGKDGKETSRLLEALRSDYQGRAKLELARDKAAIEAARREVEAARQAELRSDVAWEPSGAKLSDAWSALLSAESAYEQALLRQLGALKKEEEELICRRALRETAVARLAELLPPMMERRARWRAAEGQAAQSSASATQLAAWAQGQRKRLEAECRQFELGGLDEAPACPGATRQTARRRSSVGTGGGGKGRSPQEALRVLSEGWREEKQRRLEQTLGAISAWCEALTVQQLQRSGASTAADEAAARQLVALRAEWDALERTEHAYRGVLTKQVRLQTGPAQELRRLERGCRQLDAWVREQQAVLTSPAKVADEGAARAVVREVQRLKYDHALRRTAVVEPLGQLASHIGGASGDAALAERAGRLVGEASALFEAMEKPIEARLKAAEEEVVRQKRLGDERLDFASRCVAFGQYVSRAEEYASFPLPSYDTVEVVGALQLEGAKLAEALLPAPEGASALDRDGAARMLQAWTELQPLLDQLVEDSERAHRAKIHERKLHDEYAACAEGFEAWFATCLGLLQLAPGGAVRADDVLAALDRVLAQLPEGEHAARRAGDLLREMRSYGVEESNPCATALPAVLAKLGLLKRMTSDFRSMAKQAPPVVRPEAAIGALHELGAAAGTKGDKGKFPLPLSALAPLDTTPEGACETMRDFVIDVTEVAARARDGAPELLRPESFNPFPADQLAVPERKLPARAFDKRAHTFAIIEAVNRARSAPQDYARELEGWFDGCFEKKTLRPPWGGKLRTAEGEAALTDLLGFLAKQKPLPSLRLIDALSEAAEQLALELAEGKKKSEQTPLDRRLKSRGTWSGAGGEAVVYSVRQPDALVAMLFMGDGDATRRNRAFLMRDDLKVAGVGLADHPKLDCVGVFTLVTMFATNLSAPMTVTCKGDITPAFQHVLDAIPSEQARDIATEALVVGKTVEIAHEGTAAAITVTDRDGGKKISRLRWGGNKPSRS